jgi:hypothetical protein
MKGTAVMDERYPRVFEGDGLDGLNLDPETRLMIRRITVTNESTMVLEIGAEVTITIGVRPPMAAERPWTIRVERTLVRYGSTTTAAEDMPIQAIGLTRPDLPHPAIIEAAIRAASKDEAIQIARLKQARAFLAVLNWISPGASPTDIVFRLMYDGRAAVRWERNGEDVVLTLEVNAGPLGPDASELFS